MRLPIIATIAAAGALAAAATLSPLTAEAATSAPPVMSSTFLQPSGTTIPWTAKQYSSEISLERAAGITSVIDQWTIDEDANQAYYPDASGWYPRSSDMTGPLLSAAGAAGDTVWLGLANVSAWQSHAGDASWLNNQLYVQEQTADQLYKLYGSNKAFKGWYLSFEVSDQELGSSADATAMKSFFTSLTTYLHTHDGDKPVMTSPTYEHLTESPAQFAASVASVLGGFDVINVQDSGGSGYEQPSDITNWFTALHKALTGTRSSMWDDPDLFSASNKGGPMTPTQLQANLKAAYGQVSGFSGFSFTTQLDPNLIGTSSYYSAYQSYERKQS
jgi:Domain of unknown function (DUF4434)